MAQTSGAIHNYTIYMCVCCKAYCIHLQYRSHSPLCGSNIRGARKLPTSVNSPPRSWERLRTCPVILTTLTITSLTAIPQPSESVEELGEKSWFVWQSDQPWLLHYRGLPSSSSWPWPCYYCTVSWVLCGYNCSFLQLRFVWLHCTCLAHSLQLYSLVVTSRVDRIEFSKQATRWCCTKWLQHICCVSFSITA